jgi:hypothetical protein
LYTRPNHADKNALWSGRSHCPSDSRSDKRDQYGAHDFYGDLGEYLSHVSSTSGVAAS